MADYPEYEYHPYPRWITDKQGNRRIVENAREEAEWLPPSEIEIELEPVKPAGKRK